MTSINFYHVVDYFLTYFLILCEYLFFSCCLLSLCLLVFLVYTIGDTMLFKKSSLLLLSVISLTACKPQETSIEEQGTVASCVSNEPCIYDQQIKVWLSESTVSPETPFNINLSLPDGLKVINAKLEGVTMYMGYIPVFFKSTNGILQADTMVGVCSEKNMKWKLIIDLEDQQTKNSQVTYYFIVKQ